MGALQSTYTQARELAPHPPMKTTTNYHKVPSSTHYAPMGGIGLVLAEIKAEKNSKLQTENLSPLNSRSEIKFQICSSSHTSAPPIEKDASPQEKETHMLGKVLDSIENDLNKALDHISMRFHRNRKTLPKYVVPWAIIQKNIKTVAQKQDPTITHQGPRKISKNLQTPSTWFPWANTTPRQCSPSSLSTSHLANIYHSKGIPKKVKSISFQRGRRKSILNEQRKLVKLRLFIAEPSTSTNNSLNPLKEDSLFCRIDRFCPWGT